VTNASTTDEHAGRWERAARVEDLREDGPHALSAGGSDLVAVRTRGTLRVFEGRCPHQGALLGEGELEGDALVCRNHRWRFDRQTGQRSGGRQCLRECPSRVHGGELFVDIGALTRKAEARAKRRLEDLPGPQGIPLLGNALQLDTERLHTILEGWAAEYGQMFRIRAGQLPLLVISDPDLTAPLFRERPDTYRRISNVEPVFAEMALSGVFSAEGEAWRAQRKLAMEALAQRHLRGFYPTLAMVAERLRKRWERAAEEGREVDPADELKRFTVDVTTLLVFGHDVNTLEQDDEDVIQQHLELVFPALGHRLNSVFPYWRYFRLPEDRRLDRALASLQEWLAKLVADTRTRLEVDPARAAAPANFLESMIASRDSEGRPFSDDVIFGNALTMLLAGEDTTAYTLAWAVHHLCDDAGATSALRREIDALLGDRRVPRDLEQVSRLDYANAVANEAMRLRPIAPHQFFEPTRDVVIGDVAVPKGTGVIVLTRLPTLDAARFVEPHAFKPERWIDPGAGPHDASSLVPFGSGPRICPGRSLALVEMRVVLAMLYRNFTVERVGRTRDVTERMAFTMTPVGLRVRLKRR
jgi:cytochrome P450/nitrite reductase/ring-hydroxylating ferredoxin subunit